MHWVQYLVLATNLLKAVYEQAAENARARKARAEKARARKEQEESLEDGMTRTTTSTKDGYFFFTFTNTFANPLSIL